MSTDAEELEQARRDAAAFQALAGRHRGALLTQAYRLLGHLEGAEAVTHATFEEALDQRSAIPHDLPFRQWLYQRLARRVLALPEAPERRHPIEMSSALTTGVRVDAPETPRWLEPVPEGWLTAGATEPWGTESKWKGRDTLSLSFVLALQPLSMVQRVVFLTRDVLGFSAAATAELASLASTAFAAALTRARESVNHRRLPAVPNPPGFADERVVLEQYLEAWENSDVSLFHELLEPGAGLALPPSGQWHASRGAIIEHLSGAVFSRRLDPYRFRGLPTRANGSPAVALYRRSGPGMSWKADGLHLLEANGTVLARVTAWMEPRLFRIFGLPGELG